MLGRQRAELQRLHPLERGSTRGNAAALEAELFQARITRARMRAAWRGGGRAQRFADQAAPAGRAEAYFDLAAFVDRMRALALKHGIDVAPDATRFGFASYANGGPHVALIEQVFRQRCVVEYLVETLCAAQPKALLAVRRERPRSSDAAVTHGSGERDNARGAAVDFFALDPRASVGASEAVAAVGFQLSFVGQTATLRDFLNRLATFDLPVTVRAVEVEPVNFEEKGSQATAAYTSASPASFVLTTDSGGISRSGVGGVTDADAVPLVPKPFSKFTVTLEHVQLREPSADAAHLDAAPIARWEPPRAQPRGPDWVYDVFTPPEIFFHAQTKRFAVKPPDAFVDDEVPEEFGVELIAVRAEPFRLQLIGYVGGDGAWRGTFQDGETGDVVVAGSGHRFEGLEIDVRSVDVRLQPVVLPESMTTQQRVATAIVHDRRTDRDVVLTPRERHSDGKTTALISMAGGAQREVCEGETLVQGDAVYKMEQIHLAPPALDVVKRAKGETESDRRRLTLPRATMEDGP